MEIDNLPYLTSIVITTYNQGEFLREAVLSAVEQKYKNKEIIVVDDCSSDNTASIIQDLSQRRYECPVKFARTPQNSGTAGARNYGVSLSKGEFIAFLDGDDAYYPDKVSASVAKIAQFPQIGVAYSDYDIQYCGTHIPQTVRTFKEPFDFNKMLQRCVVSTNSVVWRRVFESVGGFDTSIRGMEDYEFWLRAATKFAFVHIPFSLFKYREHGKNKTSMITPKDWAEEEANMKNRFINQYLKRNF
jgi:glycosyltransferase involved in cell wall biosynthesis